MRTTELLGRLSSLETPTTSIVEQYGLRMVLFWGRDEKHEAARAVEFLGLLAKSGRRLQL